MHIGGKENEKVLLSDTTLRSKSPQRLSGYIQTRDHYDDSTPIDPHTFQLTLLLLKSLFHSLGTKFKTSL